MKKMRQIYTLVFYFIMPFILVRLWWRGRKQPAYRQRIAERFGRPSFSTLEQSFWVHAVSYGEAVAAEPLIRALRQQFPEIPLVITTMTITGSQRVQQSFPDVHHCYVPYDLPMALKRFYQHIKPKLLIIMETELWPNMLFYAAKNHTRILLANARLSSKSCAGYKRLPQALKNCVLGIQAVAAQSKQDVERFQQLGFAPEKLKLCGNLKFDIELPLHMVEEGKQIRQTMTNYNHVWIAASTHEGEEEQILEIFNRLRNDFPNLLLILVPRHPERFESVAKLCASKGFNIHKRSEGLTFSDKTNILIGDSMGELYLYYAIADVAFVGGSLVPIGGHNLLEPAAIHLPIFTGPYLHNFDEISELLAKANVLTIVKNKDELGEKLHELLADRKADRKSPALNNYVVFDHHRALAKHMKLITEVLC